MCEELQRQTGIQSGAGVEGWRSGVEGWRGRGAAPFGRVEEVSETAARFEVVSEADGASRPSAQLERQTSVLFLELCCLLHAGLTDNSSYLEVEMKDVATLVKSQWTPPVRFCPINTACQTAVLSLFVFDVSHFQLEV